MNDLIDTIKMGKYAFEGEEWENVSQEAKDLISNLLVIDPKQRLVPSAAMKHAWLSDTPKDLSELKTPKATLQIQKNLKKNKRKLTKSKMKLSANTKRLSFNMDIRGALENLDPINTLRLENDNQGSFTDSDPPSIDEVEED